MKTPVVVTPRRGGKKIVRHGCWVACPTIGCGRPTLTKLIEVVVPSISHKMDLIDVGTIMQTLNTLLFDLNNEFRKNYLMILFQFSNGGWRRQRRKNIQKPLNSATDCARRPVRRGRDQPVRLKNLYSSTYRLYFPALAYAASIQLFHSQHSISFFLYSFRK